MKEVRPVTFGRSAKGIKQDDLDGPTEQVRSTGARAQPEQVPINRGRQHILQLQNHSAGFFLEPSSSNWALSLFSFVVGLAD